MGSCTVNGNTIQEECRKTEIFENIIIDKVRYDTQSTVQKAKMFLGMSAWWLVGKQKKLCDRLISRLVTVSDYELIVIAGGEGGILNGAFMRQSSEKRVILLEDGLADYYPPAHAVHITEILGNLNLLVSFLLAKMNYVDICGRTHLKSARQCEKYVCRPEQLGYTDYKSVHKLFDSEKMDSACYTRLIKQAFEVNLRDLSGDVLLLTMPISELGAFQSRYKEEVENYINRVYSGKELVLKKHPRDDAEYFFTQCASVKVIPANIPGEIVLGGIPCREILMMRPGNLSGMCADTDYKILHWAKFDDVKMLRFEKFGDFFKSLCQTSGVDASHIIEL